MQSNPKNQPSSSPPTPRRRKKRSFTHAVAVPAALALPSLLLFLWQWHSFRGSSRSFTRPRGPLSQPLDTNRHDIPNPSGAGISITTFLWIYVLGGTLGMLLVMTLQVLLAYGSAAVLFSSCPESPTRYLSEAVKTERQIRKEKDPSAHREMRRRMSRRWQYWVYILVFSFVIAGVVEEGLKGLAIVTFARRYDRSMSDDGASHSPDYLGYVATAVSAALGFATMENILFVYQAYGEGDDDDDDNDNDNDNGKAPNTEPSLALIVAERMVVGTTAHVLTGALVGVNIATAVRHDVDKFPVRHEGGWGAGGSPTIPWQVLQVLWEPVLGHGSMNSMLFGISAWQGNVGWIRPSGRMLYLAILGIAVGYLSMLAGVVNQRMQELGIGDYLY